MFTKENAKAAAAASVAARKANGWRARAKTFIEHTPEDDPEAEAHERSARLWAIVAAIDRRLAAEVIRDRPNGQLMRDLTATRRGLVAQADGPELVKENAGKVAAPVLAEPEPVQE